MTVEIILLTVVSLVIASLYVRELLRNRKLSEEKENSRQEKARKEKLFDAIMHNVHAFILLIDSDFRILETNYYYLTGESQPEGKTERVGDLLRCNNAFASVGGCGTHGLCRECAIRKKITAAFKEKNSFVDLEAQLYIRHNEGEVARCTTLISGQYLVTKEGEERMVVTVHDVTHMKETEHALKQARRKAEDANKQKSAFLANMGHEIRTPLNAIVGFSELLAYAATDEEKKKYLSIVRANNELLQQLLSDILDLSKIEAGMLEFVFSEVDLNHLIIDMVQFCRMHLEEKASMVQVIEEKPLPECILRTDRNRLNQVIFNFVTNAMKFTDEGSITIGYEMENRSVRLYVKDTGCGMPAEKLPYVFDRFMRMHKQQKGNGLGLAISKSIVTSLGGRIGVISEEGKGTTFWCILPMDGENNVV